MAESPLLLLLPKTGPGSSPTTSGQGTTGQPIIPNGANLVAIGKLQRYENLHFPLDFRLGSHRRIRTQIWRDFSRPPVRLIVWGMLHRRL